MSNILGFITSYSHRKHQRLEKDWKVRGITGAEAGGPPALQASLNDVHRAAVLREDRDMPEFSTLHNQVFNQLTGCDVLKNLLPTSALPDTDPEQDDELVAQIEMRRSSVGPRAGDSMSELPNLADQPATSRTVSAQQRRMNIRPAMGHRSMSDFLVDSARARDRQAPHAAAAARRRGSIRPMATDVFYLGTKNLLEEHRLDLSSGDDSSDDEDEEEEQSAAQLEQQEQLKRQAERVRQQPDPEQRRKSRAYIRRSWVRKRSVSGVSSPSKSSSPSSPTSSAALASAATAALADDGNSTDDAGGSSPPPPAPASSNSSATAAPAASNKQGDRNADLLSASAVQPPPPPAAMTAVEQPP